MEDGDGAPQRFSRLFDLPPFAEPSQELREALIECGRPGGMMDANDPLEVGPIRLFTEPELSPNNRDNPEHTAGVTFLGQFMDHDITRDAGSRLGRATSVGRSTNLRSARLDLDSVYGGGPEMSPELYEGFRLKVESGDLFEDVPRDDAGLAILGDDRNDENLMLSGLQAAFLMFHNGEVKPNKRIDTKMSTPLFQLPMFSIPTARGEDVGPTSLATRNLLRHITWEIPSGQDVARTMGVDPLAAADFVDLGQLGANLDRSTPLFFYLLREADVVADGLHLGPTGGRIVAEVFLGMLELDGDSYLNVEGGWRPTLPQRDGTTGDDFTMSDLLTIAGVDPGSRGQ